jgi:hypothetical protein
MLKKLFILIVLISNWGQITAQDRIYVNEYLNIGVGGRALSMGGAQIASSNDANSAYWNPAGLTRIEDNLQVAAMHAEYFAGNAKYDFISIALPSKDKKRAFAVSALRFATDDIPYTIDYIQPDGSFDDSKLKSISAGDYAFTISYAQKINIFNNAGIQTSIGANAKTIYRNIGSMANAWGAGVDIGFQAAYKKWQLGLSVKDATTTYTTWSFNLTEKEKEVFGQTGNAIPVKSFEIMKPTFVVGLGYKLLKEDRKMQVLLEINAALSTDGKRNTLIKTNSISIDPRAGLEISYLKSIFLRAGVCNIQQVLDNRDTTNQTFYTLFQPSIGLGLHLGPLAIEYTYTSLQTQNNPLFSHIISGKLFIRKIAKKGKKMSSENIDNTKA